MENNIINSNSMPKRNLPRDVFLHLLAMVTLYWSAVSFITLCWQYINYFFPDALNYNYGFTNSMRFALASLFIVFPVFILVSWFLNNIYAKESQVRESKVRKWLIYLTLFVAALVIIGDLIFVINTFLGGEITMRFILKALSVLVVAAIIFGYLNELPNIFAYEWRYSEMFLGNFLGIPILISILWLLILLVQLFEKLFFDRKKVSF